MPTPVNRVGKKFGRLTVLSQKGRKMICRCDCGTVKEFWISHVTRKNPRRIYSCGCLQKEYLNRGTYKEKYGGTYNSFCCMKNRCRPNCSDRNMRRYYADAGITVCERWSGRGGGAFKRFLADMGERPSGTTLDRIDNTKGYSPKNCRWATREQQDCNKSSNRVIFINGDRLTAAQLSKASSVPYGTALCFVRRMNEPRRGGSLYRFLEGKQIKFPDYAHSN